MVLFVGHVVAVVLHPVCAAQPRHHKLQYLVESLLQRPRRPLLVNAVNIEPAQSYSRGGRARVDFWVTPAVRRPSTVDGPVRLTSEVHCIHPSWELRDGHGW